MAKKNRISQSQKGKLYWLTPTLIKTLHSCVKALKRPMSIENHISFINVPRIQVLALEHTQEWHKVVLSDELVLALKCCTAFEEDAMAKRTDL